MKKTIIKGLSAILCASMVFLSACSTQTSEETENKNGISLNNSVQAESNSRIEFMSFSDEDVAFENNTAYVNSQLLLTVDDSYTYDDVNTQIEQLGGKIIGCIEFTNDYQVEFSNSDYNKLCDIQKQLSAHFKNSSVELHKVFLSEEESNDKKSKYSNNGNWWREAVKLTDLEKESHTYQLVNVGVFDTAFDISNKDLAYAFENGEVFNNEKEKLKDKNGHHGTNVSGFLAAQKDNNYGIDGTANNVTLYGYSLFGSGDKLTHFTSAMSFKYRIATLLSKNVKVLNISLATSEVTVGAQNGIENAELLLKYFADSFTVFFKKYIDAGQEFVIVKSAGNDNGETWINCDISKEHPFGIKSFDKDKDKDLSKFTQIDKITYDAKYDLMGAITDSAVKKRIIIVGSSDKSNNRADHSENGERVDIYAPGIELKTLLDGENGAGTSYAAPITAGVVALMWGVNPDIKADDIKYLLTASASVPIENEKYQINTDSGNTIYMNKYLVNAQTAVKLAESYKAAKTSSASSTDGFLMGTVGLFNNGSVSDFGKKCTISLYKSDTDEIPFKTIDTDEYGDFFINLPAGEYSLGAVSNDGVYRSERLGFKIESSAVEYMEYLFVMKCDDEAWRSIYKTKLQEKAEEYSGSEYDPKFELIDVDQNGIPELFISQGTYRISVCEVYTINNGEIKQLSVASMYGMLNYNSKEKLLGDVHVYAGSTVLYWVGKLENGEMKDVYTSDSHGDTFIVNGEEVTLEEYNEANSKYPIQGGADWEGVGRKYSLNSSEIDTVLGTSNDKEPDSPSINAQPLVSDIIQSYNGTTYYAKTTATGGGSRTIDFSKSKYVKYSVLPISENESERYIYNFLIFNDKVYYTISGQGSAVDSWTLKCCDLDGSNITVLLDDVLDYFEINNGMLIIGKSPFYSDTCYRLDMSTGKSVQEESGIPERIKTVSSCRLADDPTEFDGGLYYRAYIENSIEVLYYRKDINSGNIEKIGSGFQPSR